MPVFKKSSQGFTLIEVVVAVAVFAILLVGVIGLVTIMTRSVRASREQTTIASLAANYLEVVRNLPYAQVGTASGNPNGVMPDSATPAVSIIEGTSYQIYYEVTYLDDPADGTILGGTDPAPDDYKQVKMFINNTATNVVRSFSTNITPLGLEGVLNAGALWVKVFDASGQPVGSAQVHIQNLAGTIMLDRTTDSSGNWVEVGLPPGVNSYHVAVTKGGFSTDQTYPITAGNPNPTKPDPTIANGLITQVSFSIDFLSDMTINTFNSSCGPLSNVGVGVLGAKLIGTSPNVIKYNNDHTSSGGQIVLNNLEWDNYTPILLTGQNLMVIGTSPIQQISVLPGASQTFTMILGTQTANSLLVIVKDSATGNALEGASVHLLRGGGTPADYFGTTGGSVWVQSDWTGGPGQDDFTALNRYFADDGNIDTDVLPTGLRLKKISGDYVSAGQLVSSTFDTGGASDYTTLTWSPASQNPATTLRFQIASNSDNATWDYKGPDGTAGTYYSVSGTNIADIHNSDRYIRYKAFLDTTDNQQTPVLTSLATNYVSGCVTPGQTSFGSLLSGNNYDLDVTISGYQPFTVNNLDISGNQSIEVLMSP